MISSSPVKTPAAPAWFVVVLVACVAAAPTEETIYAKFGDDVTLKPKNGSVTNATEGIIWKVGKDIAAELDKGHLQYFRHFKERGHLNNQTGEMTIKSLSYEDIQVYTIEIDGKPPYHKILLVVLSPVPVPTVVSFCSQDGSTCTLICEGSTVRANPVQYIWTSDNTEVPHYTDRYDITKDNSSAIREFRCKLKNPVSEESSKPFPNPLKAPESGPKISSGIIVFFILLAVVLAVAVVHRAMAGECFYNKTSMPWERNFWKNTKGQELPTEAPENNGTTTTPLQGQKDEEAAMTDR